MNEPFNTQVGGSHYKDLPIQPAEFCQRNKLGFCESSAIKYLVRHRSKNGLQDLEKAIHFIQILIGLEYTTNKKPTCLWRWTADCGKWTGDCGYTVDSISTSWTTCPRCNKTITV